MALFYDPRDSTDLARVEQLLQRGGIEYSLQKEPASGLGPMQIHVAEEDVPRAEELLLRQQR